MGADVSITIQHQEFNGGMAGLIRRIKALSGATASAGYDSETHPETLEDEGGPKTVAEIAYRNNYGLDAPERPFMDIALREGRPLFRKYGAAAVKAMLRKPSAAAMAPLAKAMARSIVDVINSGVDPGNAWATIAKKGFDHPLVESGYMRDHTKAWVKYKQSEVEVGG